MNACYRLAWTIGAALLSPLTHGAEVAVQIRLAGPDALELSYTLPPDCAQLAFLKNGASGQRIRARWQALDACATADGEQLRRAKPACPALRFRVPATTEIGGGYPGSFPVGAGIYVHVSNYAVDAQCGKVSYHFAAPGIASAGRTFEASADAGSGADSAALLMQAPLPPSGTTISYFDPRLSSEAVAQIKEVADGTIAFLKTALPNASFTPPILAAVSASAPGGPNVGGNASEVLLATFYNWPQQPGPNERAQLTLLVAHEFSHRFQLRDAVDIYPDARLIHEGGAEFLRWMTSLKLGWLTPAQAAAELDRALTTCTLTTEQQAWGALAPRFIGTNHLEYACGLPVYVYALAARQGTAGPLARINNFYRDLKLGNSPAFDHALECGDDSSCQPRWFAHLLGKDAPMAEQWRSLFEQTGLATAHPPTQFERDTMVQRAVIALMSDDCQGRSGTTKTPDGMLLDGMSSCKSFRVDADLRQIEGLPVFGAEATLARMTTACVTRHDVKLGLRGGETLTVPCTRPYPIRTQFYGVDIDKVLASLLRG